MQWNGMEWNVVEGRYRHRKGKESRKLGQKNKVLDGVLAEY